jgi:predicted RNase H-like HicB family nuclease
MKYRVVVETDEDGVFVATVPALPGCVSDGRTRAEAIENIKEAIAAYLESIVKAGDPMPEPAYDSEIVEIDLGRIEGAA